MSSSPHLAHFWDLSARLVLAFGAAPLHRQPGAWYLSLNHRFELAINGHCQTIECASFRRRRPALLPPLSAYVAARGSCILLAEPQHPSLLPSSSTQFHNLLRTMYARLKHHTSSR